MKKNLNFILATLFISHGALSESVSRDIKLSHALDYSCQMEVSNNNIDGRILDFNDQATADLTFSCTNLRGMKVVMSSKNGGLQRGEDTEQKIHYLAKIGATHLTPFPVELDTSILGTEEAFGVFEDAKIIQSSAGVLELKLIKPTTFTPNPGRYEDTLTVVLRAPMKSM